MKENFEFCLKEVLKSEGGYSNDAHDPGGPTNFGITIHDYRAYVNANGTPNDVKEMTVDQAAIIYKTKYWDPVGGDLLPSGVDYCVFDYGVNSGIRRAIHVLNLSEHKTTNPLKIIDAICDERLAFLRSLGTWKYFGKGWSTRVSHVRIQSRILATKASGPKPMVVPKSIQPQVQIQQSWLITLITSLRQLLRLS